MYVSSYCSDRYRQHDASSSAQAVRDGIYHPWKPNPARLKYLTWLNDYASEHPGANARLFSALRRELWCENHSFWGTMARIPRTVMEVAARRLGHGISAL